MWAFIGIQVSMWLAVVSQIFLLVPDMLHVVKTKDTRDNKWFKWIVWFICSGSWISYSIFMLWENISIWEVVGLAISETFNLVCLFVIYGVKIRNIIIAKQWNISERQLCALYNTVYLAKKQLSRSMRKKLKQSCKDLSHKEKIELYLNAFKAYNTAHNVNRKIKKAAKKVAKKVIKSAKKKRA